MNDDDYDDKIIPFPTSSQADIYRAAFSAIQMAELEMRGASTDLMIQMAKRTANRIRKIRKEKAGAVVAEVERQLIAKVEAMFGTVNCANCSLYHKCELVGARRDAMREPGNEELSPYLHEADAQILCHRYRPDMYKFHATSQDYPKTIVTIEELYSFSLNKKQLAERIFGIFGKWLRLTTDLRH